MPNVTRRESLNPYPARAPSPIDSTYIAPFVRKLDMGRLNKSAFCLRTGDSRRFLSLTSCKTAVSRCLLYPDISKGVGKMLGLGTSWITL